MKLLIEAGGEFNYRDKRKWTRLNYAAFAGKEPTVQALSSTQGIQIDALNGRGETALRLATGKGFSDIARALVEAGADLKSPAPDSVTPLHYAVLLGQEAIVRMLLSTHGIHLEVQASSGQTALQLATIHGHQDIVRALVEAGSDVDAKASNGQTALHLTTIYGHYDTVRALINAGSDVDAQSSEGQTALHVAIAKGFLDMVRVLVEAGSDVKTCDNMGNTPLLYAMSDENFRRDDIARIVVSSPTFNENADVHGAVGPITVLHQASHIGFTSTMSRLIERGCDVDARDYYNQTPLHYAAEHGMLAAVELLVDAGADILQRLWVRPAQNISRLSILHVRMITKR